MALDSNRPVQRVHNGGDGIWDGAAWGLGAGAAATGAMYGATVHGAKHLEALNDRYGSHTPRKPKNADYFAKRDLRYNMNAHRINQLGSAGSLFSGKKALITGGVGLMGGMITGASIDALRK